MEIDDVEPLSGTFPDTLVTSSSPEIGSTVTRVSVSSVASCAVACIPSCSALPSKVTSSSGLVASSSFSPRAALPSLCPRAASPSLSPRAASPSSRAASPSWSPRAASPSSSPRAASPSWSPRTTSPSASPKAVTPSLSQRAASPSSSPGPTHTRAASIVKSPFFVTTNAPVSFNTSASTSSLFPVPIVASTSSGESCPPKWAQELKDKMTSIAADLKTITQSQCSIPQTRCSETPSSAASIITKANNIMDASLGVEGLECTSLENGACIVKCSFCYSYLQSHLTKPDRIRGMKTSGTLAAGLVISPERADSLTTGSGPGWTHLKFRLKEHFSGLGRAGDIHLEAVKFHHAEQKRMLRGLTAISNLMRAAVQVCKMKAAAIHFETEVAFIAECGGEVGDIQHSRKSFPLLLETAAKQIDAKVEQQLSLPLPNTGVPPFWWVTMDKSTPSRVTNQAVMVCPMVDGKRRAIFVDAPPVYDSLKKELDSGKSDALAREVVKCIKTKYPSVEVNSWVGVSADGQYQARGFIETIFSNMRRPDSADEWYAVVWDGAHWVDLAAKDCVKGVKILRLVLKRCGIFHTQLSRGRGNCMIHAVAAEEGVTPLVTKSYSSTRFISSNFTVFETVFKMYPVYIKSLINEKTFVRAEDEDKCGEMEYLLCGDDFAMDLVVTLDVLEPLVTLMLLLQDLQQPCWKVVTWVPAVIERFTAMLDGLEEKGWESVAPNLWPRVHAHWPSIQLKAFQDIHLVAGWRIDPGEAGKDEDVEWTAREVEDDCLQDTITFLRTLRETLQTRFEKAVPQLLHTLRAAVDLHIFLLSCLGSFCPPPVNQFIADSPREMPEAFDSLVKHVKELVAIEESSFQIYQRAILAFEWIIFSREDSAASTRAAVFKSTPKLSVSSHPVKFYRTTSALFSPQYIFDFEDGSKITVELDEAEMVHQMYTQQEIFERLGPSFCRVLDVALSKGGPEAVVESLYSVMGSQQMPGQQSNETLINRTKVDWSLPPSVVSCSNFIEGAPSDI